MDKDGRRQENTEKSEKFGFKVPAQYSAVRHAKYFWKV